MKRTTKHGLKILVVGLFMLGMVAPVMGQESKKTVTIHTIDGQADDLNDARLKFATGGDSNALDTKNSTGTRGRSGGLSAVSSADKDRGGGGVKDTTPDTAEMTEIREKVRLMLSGFEYFPTRADLDAVAGVPIMTSVLKKFVKDTSASPALRFRAVDALGYYDEVDVGSLLLQIASGSMKSSDKDEAHTLEMMRHRAIIAYSKSQASGGNEALIPMLKDEDLQIRLTAISALGKHGGPEAIKHLRLLKEQDTNHAVQRELHKFVK